MAVAVLHTPSMPSPVEGAASEKPWLVDEQDLNWWGRRKLQLGRLVLRDSADSLDDRKAMAAGRNRIVLATFGAGGTAVLGAAVGVLMHLGIQQDKDLLDESNDELPGSMFEIGGQPADELGYDSLSYVEAAELGADLAPSYGQPGLDLEAFSLPATTTSTTTTPPTATP